jgi:hypothetical protein
MNKFKHLTYLFFAALIMLASCGEDEEEPLPGAPPVVNAGPDIDAVVGSSVQLNANASDPDGDPLNFAWSVTAQPSNSSPTLNNATSQSATFIPDVAGSYTLTITVDDNIHPAVSDELTVTAAEAVGDPPNISSIVADDNSPVSESNENNSVTVGTPIFLSGTNTFDPDTEGDEVTYSWSVTEAPTGSNNAVFETTDEDSVEVNFIPDVIGEYTVQLTVTDPDGNSDSETVVIIADANPVEISSNITEDTTWPNVFDDPSLPDYIVTSAISVNQELTIDPDVRVIFEPNTSMSIRGDGALVAEGTSNELIVLTAEDEANGWGGIIFFNNNVLNKLEYVEVAYGGRRDAVSGVLPANIGLEAFSDAQASIDNCIINNSFGDGVYVEVGAGLITFTNNTIEDNTDYPVSLAIDEVDKLDATSTFAGNGDNMVRILGSTLDLDDELTIPTLADGVSYFLPDDITVNSGLAIEAGASFAAASETYITINSSGYLKAEGTTSDKISFTAEDTGNGWRGLFFQSNNNLNSLDHVEISYGGNATGAASGVEPSAIGMEAFFDSRLKIKNTTISNSLNYGIFVEGDAELTEFESNAFNDNDGFPIGGSIFNACQIDNASTFSGNGTNAVEVFTSILASGVDKTLSKIDDGTPYRATGNVSLDAELTVEAGSTFEFEEGIIFSVNSQGTIIAEGTSTDMITFTASNTSEPWGGIVHYSTSTSNVMSFCTISYGGNRNAVNGVEPANLGLESFFDAELKLTDCNITNSSGFGIYNEGINDVNTFLKDANNDPMETQAAVEAAGNTFSNNNDGPSNLPAN